MTLTSTSVSNQSVNAATNGTTTAFSFPFKLNPGDAVLVRLDGQEVSPSAYTLAIASGEGGTVSFAAPPVTGQVLTIEPDPSFEQPLSFTTFDAATLNSALDRAAVRDLALKAGTLDSTRVKIVASLTNGAVEESARLQAALDSLTNGMTLILLGDWLIGSKVEVSGLYNLTITGLGGATIQTQVKNWSDKAVFVMRDCIRSQIEGITFNGSGSGLAVADPAVPTDSWLPNAPTPLAIVSTGPNGNSTNKISSDIRVRCDFHDSAVRAIGVRLVDGIRISGRFYGRQPNASFIDIVRCDNIDVADCHFVTTFVPGAVGGSDVVVSPGTQYINAGEADLNFTGAINFANIPYETTPHQATAPTGTSVWTIPYGGGIDANDATGLPTAANSWFFQCYDFNGASDVRNEQIKVQSIDTVARTVTVKLFHLDGATAMDFQGQKFRITSIDTSIFCRDIKVQGCRFVNTPGCGVFLLGCRDFVISGNTARNNHDYSYDVEWCMDGQISNNVVNNRSAVDVNEAIGVLFFARNITVEGNTIVNAANPANSGGIGCHSHGQANANIIISNNSIERGGIFLGGWNEKPGFCENVVIENNSIRSPHSAAIALHGKDQFPYSYRNITIRNNEMQAASGNDFLSLACVYDVLIEGNRSFGAGNRWAVVYFQNMNKKIRFSNNRIRHQGAAWIGFPLVMFYGTANAPEVRFDNNLIEDEEQSTGVARNLYADINLAPLPAYRRGEARIALASTTLAASASASTTATVLGARPGFPVHGWSYTAPGDRMVSAYASADNQVTLTVRNMSSVAIDPAGDYGVLVHHR